MSDLAIEGATKTELTLRWTQVDDGTGEPARYRVKFSEPDIVWKDATIGCDRTLIGDRIGADMTCTITGLTPATTYDVQLMSYRSENGFWVDAAYSNVVTGATRSDDLKVSVTDLDVLDATHSSMTMGWTQVSDSEGDPARYRVKYASPMGDWKDAAVGCNVAGDEIGAPISCTIAGLASGTSYDVQLMSYRLEDGMWVGARYSNLSTGTTTGEPGTPGG